MPVEIKELIIRAVVDEASGANTSASSAPSQGAAPEAMIQVCVERVLEILKDQKDR